jgi:hypothetical protein
MSTRHLHRCAIREIELIEQDNGRQIVPLHTGKVQIGLTYQPKPTAQDARWIEHHRAPGYGMGWGLAFGAVSMLGLVVMWVTR